MNPLPTQNINPQTVLLRVYRYFHYFYFPQQAFQFRIHLQLGKYI